ncbi:hypothetical protein ABZ517_05605 [Streptomyces scabiei]|uniref:DUF7873 family protein n=1 Tax=Streptomyces scabiei TaxID=1930 RepID=UPI0033FBF08F
MTTLLSQIVAVEKPVKTEAYAVLNGAHHQVQKAPLLAGITRTYRPLHEEGEQLPPESTRVQLRAIEALAEVREALTRFYDVTATRDWANCAARADVTINGRTLIADVPVPYLLFLEKQLKGLATFLEKLPVLDAAEEWHWDQDTGVWRTPAYDTIKTKKMPRNHVLAEATDRHPAQVEMWHEDVPVGTWSTVKFSGALPASHRKLLVDRVQALRDAVKFARERANSTEISQIRVAPAVFDFLFTSFTPPANDQAAAA